MPFIFASRIGIFTPNSLTSLIDTLTTIEDVLFIIVQRSWFFGLAHFSQTWLSWPCRLSKREFCMARVLLCKASNYATRFYDFQSLSNGLDDQWQFRRTIHQVQSQLFWIFHFSRTRSCRSDTCINRHVNPNPLDHIMRHFPLQICRSQ